MRLWRRKRVVVRVRLANGGELIAPVDAIHWDRWFGVTLRDPYEPCRDVDGHAYIDFAAIHEALERRPP